MLLIKSKSNWMGAVRPDLEAYIAHHLPNIPSTLIPKFVLSLTQTVDGQSIGDEYDVVNTFATEYVLLWDLKNFDGLYQDSAGGTPVTANGQVVGQAKSIIGNCDLIQTTTGSKPIITASGLYFNGVNNFLENISQQFALTNHTAILVIEPNNANFCNGLLRIRVGIGGNDYGGGDDGFILYTYAYGSYLVQQAIGLEFFYGTPSGLHIHSQVVNGTSAAMYYNSTLGNTTASWASLAAQSAGGITIGSRLVGGSEIYFLDGYVRAICYFPIALSPTQQTQVERTLNFLVDGGIY